MYAEREEKPLILEMMVDEEIQYDNEKENSQLKETKGKKLQVGSSRLESDFDVSCQSGHLIMESECQTDEVITIDEVKPVMMVKEESRRSIERTIEYEEKEIQSDLMPIVVSKSGKKVQVGYPRTSEQLEVACQSGRMIESSGCQTEIEEDTIDVVYTEREEKPLELEMMIDEEIQYYHDRQNSQLKETKGKKLQVGSSRLESDFDVSCQSGHLIMESECQTDEGKTIDEVKPVMMVKEESRRSFERTIEYEEKEIQSDLMPIVVSKSGKKIQVGYPRTCDLLEVACQSGNLVMNSGCQTNQTEEVIDIQCIEHEESRVLLETMIDEEIQYGKEEKMVVSATKGKKMQVGASRIFPDREIACQTGHLVVESEFQTENNDNHEQVIESKVFKEHSKIDLDKRIIVYDEKEIQSDIIPIVKTRKGKNIQTGYPKIVSSSDISIQSSKLTTNSGCQTEEVETLEECFIEHEENQVLLDMIDEEIQYNTTMFQHTNMKKGKKLQVGPSRLESDCDVSCQVGHIMMDSGFQTEKINEITEVKPVMMTKEESMRSIIEYEEKEVQSDFVLVESQCKGKKVQVGNSQIGRLLEVACQSGRLLENSYCQTEVEEESIEVYYTEREEKPLVLDTMIEEEIQYDCEIIKTKTKAKKMQVGGMRMIPDSDVSCQTGHVIMESECQTDTIEEVKPEILSKEESRQIIETVKYEEKAIQYDLVPKIISKIGKKVQVGNPRLGRLLDAVCQSGKLLDNSWCQTEIEEESIEVCITEREEKPLVLDAMIEEEIQYEQIIPKMKSKKMQVGGGRMFSDSDVSCQTGHIVMESECQTELLDKTDALVQPIFSQKSESKLDHKEDIDYYDKEIQCTETIEIKKHTKKIQAGNSRLEESRDAICQFGRIIADTGVQVDADEDEIDAICITQENVAIKLDVDLIEADIQYDKQISVKGKKLQVGESQLNDDCDAYVQTGHQMMETECQTSDNFDVEDSNDYVNIDVVNSLHKKPDLSWESDDKLVQYELPSKSESKNQAGYSKLKNTTSISTQKSILKADDSTQIGYELIDGSAQSTTILTNRTIEATSLSSGIVGHTSKKFQVGIGSIYQPSISTNTPKTNFHSISLEYDEVDDKYEEIVKEINEQVHYQPPVETKESYSVSLQIMPKECNKETHLYLSYFNEQIDATSTSNKHTFTEQKTMHDRMVFYTPTSKEEKVDKSVTTSDFINLYESIAKDDKKKTESYLTDTESFKAVNVSTEYSSNEAKSISLTPKLTSERKPIKSTRSILTDMDTCKEKPSELVDMSTEYEFIEDKASISLVPKFMQEKCVKSSQSLLTDTELWEDQPSDLVQTEYESQQTGTRFTPKLTDIKEMRKLDKFVETINVKTFETEMSHDTSTTYMEFSVEHKEQNEFTEDVKENKKLNEQSAPVQQLDGFSLTPKFVHTKTHIEMNETITDIKGSSCKDVCVETPMLKYVHKSSETSPLKMTEESTEINDDKSIFKAISVYHETKETPDTRIDQNTSALQHQTPDSFKELDEFSLTPKLVVLKADSNKMIDKCTEMKGCVEMEEKMIMYDKNSFSKSATIQNKSDDRKMHEITTESEYYHQETTSEPSRIERNYLPTDISLTPKLISIGDTTKTDAIFVKDKKQRRSDILTESDKVKLKERIVMYDKTGYNQISVDYSAFEDDKSKYVSPIQQIGQQSTPNTESNDFSLKPKLIRSTNDFEYSASNSLKHSIDLKLKKHEILTEADLEKTDQNKMTLQLSDDQTDTSSTVYYQQFTLKPKVIDIQKEPENSDVLNLKHKAIHSTKKYDILTNYVVSPIRKTFSIDHASETKIADSIQAVKQDNEEHRPDTLDKDEYYPQKTYMTNKLTMFEDGNEKDSSLISLSMKPKLNLPTIKSSDKSTSIPTFKESFARSSQTFDLPNFDEVTQTKLTGERSISQLSSTPKHFETGSEVNFEDEYIVECMKSRSVVTTKQEILPSLSSSFVTKEEESAIRDGSIYQTSLLPSLVNTKTQSWDNQTSSFNVSKSSQTHHEILTNESDIIRMYNVLQRSKYLKNTSTETTDYDDLIEYAIEKKGIQYALIQYQKYASTKDFNVQTNMYNTVSTKTQYTPERPTSSSTLIQTIPEYIDMEEKSSSRLDTNTDTMSTSRPSHKNKRIQRGSSYFQRKNAETNTIESYGDHIEVTYTETITEESVVTKRPVSKLSSSNVEETGNESKRSSLARTSAKSTPIPISNISNKAIQTDILPTQCFITEHNFEYILAVNRNYSVRGVKDYQTNEYISLSDAISKELIDLKTHKLRISSRDYISLEDALIDKLIIT